MVHSSNRNQRSARVRRCLAGIAALFVLGCNSDRRVIPDKAPITSTPATSPTLSAEPTKSSAHRFGKHSFAYPGDVMFPKGDRAALDAATLAFYKKWKAAYLARGC